MHMLNIEILRALAQCRNYLLPEPTLVAQLRLTVRPAPLAGEVAAALVELESRRLVQGLRPGLGGPLKWAITNLGRAALAEAVQ